jgi:hypothetical protein
MTHVKSLNKHVGNGWSFGIPWEAENAFTACACMTDAFKNLLSVSMKMEG